jgi:lauroyl/myristoyl acyltransferase
MLRAMQTVMFWIEAGGALFAYGLLRVLPLSLAAAVGEAVLRRVGPLLSLHRIAGDNLRAAFPDKDQAWIDTVRWGADDLSFGAYGQLGADGRCGRALRHPG